MTDLVNRRPAGFNYSFRPASYFEGLDTKTLLLASICGEQRRRDVEKGLKSGDFDPRVWGEWLTEPTLDPETRKFLGAIHPSLMSGEYLPPIGEEEVEIARIVLASVMGDVTSIRARRSQKQICYSIVDEHETEYLLMRKCSAQPLSMEDLIGLINTVGHAEDAYAGGVAIGHVLWHVEEGFSDEMRGFVTVESAFYPELNRFYHTVINDYLDELETVGEKEDEQDA